MESFYVRPKLNAWTENTPFFHAFDGPMVERLGKRGWNFFLDGYLRYNEIFILPEEQENITFTCPYGTSVFKHVSIGFCNTPATFQRCMLSIFADMLEDTMEVFIDDFSMVGDTFKTCLEHLSKVLNICV